MLKPYDVKTNTETAEAVEAIRPAAKKIAEIIDFISSYMDERTSVDRVDIYEQMEMFDSELARGHIDLGMIQARILSRPLFDFTRRRPTTEALDLQALIESDEDAFDNLVSHAHLYYAAEQRRDPKDIAVDEITFDFEREPDNEDLYKIDELVAKAREAWEETDTDPWYFEDALAQLINKESESGFFQPDQIENLGDEEVRATHSVHIRETLPIFISASDLVSDIREELPEEPDIPPRELFRVGDATSGIFVVHELEPEYLRFEGAAMGHCVGRPGMGYTEAVRRGDIAIISVRTPAGRPKFTIEARLGADEEIEAIDQVKGKANRLPGFGGKKFKAQEVAMLEDVIRRLGVDPWQVEDMVPGLEKLYGRPRTRDNPRRTFDEPWHAR